MLRVLRMVVAHDVSEYKYMDDVTENLARGFENVCKIISDYASESLLNLEI